MNFKPGDRVRISLNYHWAQGAFGIIDNAPDFAKDLVAKEAPWKGHRRFVQGVARLIELYWVWFDEPQYDPDGDGPYKGSEIESQALELLDSSSIQNQ
ncbi:MAG: hypothetical protein L0287_01495 [Anaerolineae bacterium]|nr:hypothetical protein [Anaerolineae bacterium]